MSPISIISSSVLFSPPPYLPTYLPTYLQLTSTADDVEKIAYSYGEQAAYLTILWSGLIFAIIWFLLRYANRSLFKWHTVSHAIQLPTYLPAYIPTYLDAYLNVYLPPDRYAPLPIH